jgi:two-component system, cell cycle sensor histidine kinase and response regulator CckA
MLLDLVQNVALLVALTVGMRPLTERFAHRPVLYGVLAGALFGLVGVVGMATPLVFAEGVIYDGRSVVLSLAGLFGGPITAAVAALACGAYRAHVGGPGVYVGIAVIVEAALLGVLLHRLRQRDPAWGGAWRLLAFALLVHVIMLALQLLIPGGVGWQVLRQIGPVVLTAYPLAFLLLAQLFLASERSRRSEESLREREELQLAMVACSPVALYSVDLQGKVQIWNESAQRVFGWTAAEVVGRPLPVVPEDRIEEYRSLMTGLIQGEGFTGREVVRRRKDGSLLVGNLSTAPIRDASGEVVAIMGAMEDITERKKLAEEREELEAQLRQAQKMEAVGQLAGGVAHDFNNLLQVISGYGELARADAPAEGPLADNLREVSRAAERATVLVRQLLAFSRRQVLEMREIDLDEVIADVARMIRRVIGEHIDLTIMAGHDLGTVRADPGQIEQILMNLCINARDAMPDGGTITIETENVRIDEEYCRTHAWAAPGRYALLSLTDTGCGMDAETMGRIFEPFFTTKPVGEGTGLGLATVYGLVKQHQGLVHVYSEVGRGTTFKIYLPLVERRAVAVGDKIEGPPPGGTETVLVAEDESMVCELTRTILEGAGYRVLCAADGEEALRLFEGQADAIDLAILDVVMPGLGGRDVHQRMLAERPDIRVLFSSGYSMNAIHTNFVLDHGLALIQKPFSRETLLHKVRDVLDGRGG